MTISNSNEMTVVFREAADKKVCPECGGQMEEMERCNENESLFVWYQCVEANCDGQWLQRIRQ